jgi:hypothetical protein
MIPFQIMKSIIAEFVKCIKASGVNALTRVKPAMRGLFIGMKKYAASFLDQ